MTRNGKASRSSSARSPGTTSPCSGRSPRQVGADLGEADGVIVFDPSAFAKKGTESVGVAAAVVRPARQDGELPGRCVHGVRVAQRTYARQYTSLSSRGMDEGPDAVQSGRSPQGDPVPHPSRTGVGDAGGTRRAVAAHLGGGRRRDGPSRDFRLKLRGRGERYLLAVPSNTLVRDLDAAPPEYAGRGPHPLNPFVRVDRWCAALPDSAWTTIEVRDGEKGPLTVDVVKCRVRARTPTGGTGPDELLFITRERQADGTFKHDYYLSNADPEVPLQELARVAKAAHRIEECLKRAKGEAGLGDYQVRNWSGLASSPNPGAAGRVVPESGDAAGKKSRPPR